MAEVRFYPTTLNKTTISAEDLLDIQIMKAGVNQFKSAKMRVDEFQSATTNFINFSRIFQASEVQTLANAPVELLPPIDDSTYHVIDAILIVRGLVIGSSIEQGTTYSIKEAGIDIFVLLKDNFIEPLAFYNKFTSDGFQVPPLQVSSNVTFEINLLQPNFTQGKIEVQFKYQIINLLNP